MAWLEKQEGESWRVCVLEQRGRTVWERVARGRRNARGRIRLMVEAQTEHEASEMYQRRVAELESNGFVILDPSAGVDALYPRTASTQQRAPLKPKINEFVRELEKSLATLPERSRGFELLQVLDSHLRAPRAFRTQGLVCETYRDSVRIVAKVTNSCDYWREIGFEAKLEVPDDRETLDDRIDVDVGKWAEFLADLADSLPWRTVKNLRCKDVKVVDDEID